MPEPAELPPISQEPISVVLPVHNQEQHLPELIRGWRAYLDSLARDYEILIVDDGSTDRTGELAERETFEEGRLHVIRQPVQRGVGAAIRAGLEVARYPLFFYADGNGSYQPAELKLLLEVVDHVHLVAGYRVVTGRRFGRPWKEHLYRRLVRLVFGVRLKDVDCSFKLFRREIFPRIPIQSDGPFVHSEILAKANFLGCLMMEVPVTYKPTNALESAPFSFRERWVEGVRVFRYPDFGPAIIAEKSSQASNEPEMQPPAASDPA